MKKYLAFILALLLIASSFMGCDMTQNSDIPDNDETTEETKAETESDPEEDIELIDGFESTYIVPVIIKKERFESEILAKITDETERNRLISFYRFFDVSNDDLTELLKEEIIKAYPICEEFAIYVCDVDIHAKELQYFDAIIKKSCPDYTHKDLAYDSEMCGYTQEQIMEMRQIKE